MSELRGGVYYPDGYFDFIYSFEVLEHVQDPKEALMEIYRLLKPNGGVAYIATCNYDSFYEGHYKKFWNPFLGVEGNRKRFIRKGLSPKFLNELNFVTKRQIKAWAKELGFYSIQFNPRVYPAIYQSNFDLQYPTSFTMPQVNNNSQKPYWLHKFIEKPRVDRFLRRFDREYKLYLLLTK